MGKRGRPPVLDEQKRGQILAILGVGCSQAVAARYVGCAVSTIQRLAQRDPSFAAELSRVRCNAELGLVKNIRSAATKEQYWRAAAWALERGFPDKYVRRDPALITPEQLAEVLREFAKRVMQMLPADKYRQQIVKDAEMLARRFGQTIKEEEVPDESD